MIDFRRKNIDIASGIGLLHELLHRCKFRYLMNVPSQVYKNSNDIECDSA